MPGRTRLYTTVIPALLVAGAVALGGGTVAAIKTTERPAFCTSCHEMKPYYDAWTVGPHKNVSCVECHVDPGTKAEVTHKVSALKEVYDHFASKPKFPSGDVDVPNARCTSCHADLPVRTKSGFPHAQHVKDATCASCHPTTGHQVSPETLKKAGLLADGVLTIAATSAETTGGAHIKIDCSRCHDLKKTACETCHTSRHKARGKCETCHAAGLRWTFAHPDASASCTTCHEKPKGHFAGSCASCHDLKTAFEKTVYKHTSATCTECHATTPGHRTTSEQCSACHPKKGVSWEFAHPGSPACGSCHAAPRNHFGSSCSSCHSPKVAFAATRYTHTSKACGNCHRPPSRHFRGSCSSCHTPSVAFAATKWRHPSSTTCQSCHSRPGGHASGACETCHKQAGRNWAFSHPGSSACSSCHRAPGSHFGSNCAGCHSSGRAWSNASFSHPSTHHSWRSMACSKCHPSGPPRVGCTCHGGGSGPVDD